jgi:hypothetical protein
MRRDDQHMSGDAGKDEIVAGDGDRERRCES